MRTEANWRGVNAWSSASGAASRVRTHIQATLEAVSRSLGQLDGVRLWRGAGSPGFAPGLRPIRTLVWCYGFLLAHNGSKGL
jgi:hypothetical protein